MEGGLFAAVVTLALGGGRISFKGEGFGGGGGGGRESRIVDMLCRQEQALKRLKEGKVKKGEMRK